ncbi:hypothetical protein [Salinivibrio siamensis]|nr:hypothetical protein [Salinivibrio siamensis]
MTKLAFVSGGSKGIGLGCVLRLVEADYKADYFVGHTLVIDGSFSLA